MAVNTELPPRRIQDSLFGILAVRYHFVLEEQVEEGLAIQDRYRAAGGSIPRLGEILAERGYITAVQVQAVLKGQITGIERRFGEIAVAMHFVPLTEVEAAVKVQEQIRACGSHQRLGEILVARGGLRPHQVHAVLREQGKAVVMCPQCHTRANVLGLTPGAYVNCPRCKSVFQTPSASASAVAEGRGLDEDVSAEITASLTAVGELSASSGISRLTNAVVGKYQLGVKLGADSSGVLYKAFEPQTGTHVALRMLHPATTMGRTASERWLSAGEAASELVHPNLQRILEIGSDGGRIYLAMEFVDGDPLRLSMERRGKYPVLEALDILIQMAEAVAYGHAHGFLHGDLRPAHVIIGYDGMVRVSGLGTPKNVAQNLRQVAQQLGDEALPLYTPPEVIIATERADQRSDIYSLGAIGYHLLGGRPPHEGANVLQLGLKLASENPRPLRELEPAIPPYVNRLIGKCLQPEPDDRYDAVEDLAADLRKARQAFQTGVSDVPEIAPPPTISLARRLALRAREKPGGKGERPGRLRTHIPRGPHGAARRPGSPLKPRMPTPVRMPKPASALMKSPRPLPAAAAMPPAPGSAPSESPTGTAEPLMTADDADALQAELLAEDDEAQPAGPVQAGAHAPAGLAAAQRKTEGKPMGPGVSTRAVLIGSGVTVVLALVLIVALSRSAPTHVAQDPKPKAEAATPALTAADGPAASQEWRVIQKYIKENASDHARIVQLLGAYKLRFVDRPRPAEQAQAAMELLKKHSELGMNASLPELRTKIQALLEADKFDDASREVERWQDQWRWEAGAAQLAQDVRAENAARQKQIAESRMNDAARLRQEKKWDEAYAMYRRITDNFAPEYAAAARKAKAEAVAEADASLGQAEREARAKQAADAKAARETAAPARLAQLTADVEAALKAFDLEQCKRVLDAAAEQLAGTPQDADAQALRADYKRLADLRERIVKGAKSSRYSVPRVTYRGQTYAVLDLAEKGPVVETGAGRIALTWTDISTDDVAEFAKRASNSQDGGEMLALGMLCCCLGKPYEGKQALGAAERLGTPPGRYMAKVESQLKEFSAKVKAEADAAAAKEAAAKEAAAKEAAAKDAAAAQAAAQGTPPDPEVVKALAAKNLEVRHGIWKVGADGIMQANPDPKDQTPNLMSLKRPIGKTFKTISVEVRGTGDAAGFSFGEGRRYTVTPTLDWQKLTIERGSKVVFKVGNDARESTDTIGKDVTPENLVTEGVLYLRFKGVKGEFRNLVVEE